MAKKINLGKVGITTDGNYDSGKSYEKLVCVLHNGISWVSTKDVPAGNVPADGSAYWQKMSERGEQGPQGERGPQGNSSFDGNGVEIVNNLTQGGEAAVLSAEQGKILKTELTELESGMLAGLESGMLAGLDSLLSKGSEIQYSNVQNGYILPDGTIKSVSNWITYKFPIVNNKHLRITGHCAAVGALYVFYDNNDNILQQPNIRQTGQNYTDYLIIVPNNAASILINAQQEEIVKCYSIDSEINSIKSTLSKKIEVLEGISDHWRNVKETGWEIGQKMYNTDTHVINICASVDSYGGVESWSRSLARSAQIDCIYINKEDYSIYVYNGTTLIKSYNELFDNLSLINYFVAGLDTIVAGLDTIIHGGDTDDLKPIQGGINAFGVPTSDQNRIRLENRFYSENIEVCVKCTNIAYGIRFFEYEPDGTFVRYETHDTQTGGYITYTLASTSNYLLIVFLKSDGSNIVPSDFDNIEFRYNTSLVQTDIQVYRNSLVKRVDILGEPYKKLDVVLEQGSITATGIMEPSEYRIRTKTKFTPINTDSYTFAISNIAYKIRLFEFEENGTYIRYFEDSSSINKAVRQLGNYWKVAFLKSDGTAISIDDYAEIGFTYNSEHVAIDTYVLQDDLDNLINNKIEDDLYGQTSICNLKGKTVTFIGDSITAGGSPSTPDNLYHQVFSRLTGCISRNKGVWSTCIAHDVDNDTQDDTFVSRATAQDLNNSSLVVVFGGINDYEHDNLPIGDLFYTGTNGEKLPNTNIDCFAGGVHNLINTIRTNAPLVPILFITPIYGRYRAHSPNKNGEFVSDFQNAIKEICKYYSVPVFDLQSVYQWDFTNADIRDAYSADGLHPNDAGHIYIGKLLFRYVINNIAI